MARFFVETLPEAGATFRLDGENAKHAKVLRLRPDEEITLCDGAARECVCRFLGGEDFLWRGGACPAREPAVRVSVYLAFPKADKLEHVIQKAAELGAAELVAFPSRYCVSRPDEKSLPKKLERWQKIARSAAEQSRRGRIPGSPGLPSYRRGPQGGRAGRTCRSCSTKTKKAARSAPPWRPRPSAPRPSDDRRRGRLRRRRGRAGRGRGSEDLHPGPPHPPLRDRSAGGPRRPDVRRGRILTIIIRKERLPCNSASTP